MKNFQISPAGDVTMKGNMMPLCFNFQGTTDMVLGYDPDRLTKSTYYHHLASGTLGGIVTRATISPFDVVKIRFQVMALGIC